MKQKILFLSLIAVCYSCQKEVAPNEPIIAIKSIPDEGVTINKWQVLGPFPTDIKEGAINVDNLDTLGYKESTIRFNDFLFIASSDSNYISPIDSCFKNQFINSGPIPLEYKNIPGIPQNFIGNYYLACKIHCRKNISTRLHFSNGTGQKIWLNHELINSDDRIEPIASYRYFIPVSLKEGDNLLLIKINIPNVLSEMYVRLENESPRAMERYYGLHNHHILESSNIIWTNNIKLDVVFPPSDGEITIYDRNDNLLFKDSIYKDSLKWVRSISHLKNGDYLVKAKIDNIVLSQDIYKGDVQDSIQKIIAKLENYETSQKTQNNINALLYRFNHLLRKTYKSDMKFVTLFTQIRDIYYALHEGDKPFNHKKGNFIRSYISEIDSSLQYYRLHVPSSYNKNNPMAAVANIPAIISNLPYLESFRVANNKLSDFFQDLAEKYNMIVIEPGARRYKHPNYNAIEEFEYFAILKDIEADYNIDSNRLYLASTCSGGNEMIKMAIKYPDKFAAIATIAPEIIIRENFENPWKKANYPASFLNNIKQLPFLDIHSIINRHVSIIFSENLNELAQKHQLENFHYQRLINEYPKYDLDDFYDELFAFVNEYTLNTSPKEVDFTTNQLSFNKSFWFTINDMGIPGEAHVKASISGNKLTILKKNITAYTIDLTTLPYNKNKRLKVIDNDNEVFYGTPNDTVLYIGPVIKPGTTIKTSKACGPLAQLFNQKFIVVKGTSGNLAEKDSLNAIAETFKQTWYNRYFTQCIIKNDTDITDYDIKNANLFLLGTPTSNSFINTIKNEIPLIINDNSITIKGQRVPGKKLCFYMVYANPKNKNMLIGIIGYNNPECISLGSENREWFNDVSDYGWYDYKIWNFNENKHPWLSGYFNSSWE